MFCFEIMDNKVIEEGVESFGKYEEENKIYKKRNYSLATNNRCPSFF